MKKKMTSNEEKILLEIIALLIKSIPSVEGKLGYWKDSYEARQASNMLNDLCNLIENRTKG
jgi:hypothetical protein